MTVQDAIGWFQSKLPVNDSFGLHGIQDEAARLALIALIEQEERLKNRPLTLEELREMHGEPVFIESCERGSGWCIVNWNGIHKSWLYFSRTGTAEGMTATPISAKDYGETWLAYRRKPEKVTDSHGTCTDSNETHTPCEFV